MEKGFQSIKAIHHHWSGQHRKVKPKRLTRAPEIHLTLSRRHVQVQIPQLHLLTPLLHDRRSKSIGSGGGEGGHPVPPHVAAQGLADGELESAHGALVRPRLWQLRARIVGEPRPLVARPVAAESLEGGEPPVAGLALENPVGRRRRPAGRDVDDAFAAATAREEHENVGHVDALGHPCISVSLHYCS